MGTLERRDPQGDRRVQRPHRRGRPASGTAPQFLRPRGPVRCLPLTRPQGAPLHAPLAGRAERDHRLHRHTSASTAAEGYPVQATPARHAPGVRRGRRNHGDGYAGPCSHSRAGTVHARGVVRSQNIDISGALDSLVNVYLTLVFDQHCVAVLRVESLQSIS